jgi:hypothetical protein
VADLPVLIATQGLQLAPDCRIAKRVALRCRRISVSPWSLSNFRWGRGSDTDHHKMGSTFHELLTAVYVEGRPGDRCVGHEVDGQCGDVGRAYDASDRQRRTEVLASRVQFVA